MKSMRKSTLTELGLGSVIDFFDNGRPPVQSGDLIDAVFGYGGERGALVITGGSGIVGSGKAMQLGARLLEYGVPVVALDLPGAPDGIGGQYAGLRRAFGDPEAAGIMSGIVKMHYDTRQLPPLLKRFKPRFVLEAIPEILEIKREHYAMWREAYPGLEIRSVTSGFPSSELGVGILHPSFPHPVNKVWEVVESAPSPITQLLWALGLIPLPVGDHWSFILDVLFCGVTLAAIRFHEATNMPFWKVDKYVRRLLGPNPLRAQDAIGPGANFLTWSCLHHLAGIYGALFTPAGDLERRKTSGESWYLSSRPVVDWPPADEAALEEWLLGPILQMTSLLVGERRASLPVMNIIGELCAQFSVGMPARARSLGAERIRSIVEGYHKRHPEAAKGAWFPEAFSKMDAPEWRQLYVNAEHNGDFGVITIGRESINSDVIQELNRAIDWLRAERIDRIIVTADFHLTTQLVGADTVEFYPALEDQSAGLALASAWSRAARRLHHEFAVSVGFINGKRCLGGMLELLAHCHYLVAVSPASLGMPEVTLPVVPGMEGCHWLMRKCPPSGRMRVLDLLVSGKPVRAEGAVGWLVDHAGGLGECLALCRDLATGKSASIPLRKLEDRAFDVSDTLTRADAIPSAATPAAREAVVRCIRDACACSSSEALDVQARHSAAFMTSDACRRGAVGAGRQKQLTD